MQLMTTKTKIDFPEGVKFIKNFRQKFHKLDKREETTIFHKETSLALMDILDALESMYLGSLTLQLAVDQVLGGHYERTKNWDGLSQEITDSFIQSLIAKFFGNPKYNFHIDKQVSQSLKTQCFSLDG
jgi:hypothetical protein